MSAVMMRRLRACRIENRLKFRDVADTMGVDASLIAHWENMTIEPNEERLEQWRQALALLLRQNMGHAKYWLEVLR